MKLEGVVGVVVVDSLAHVVEDIGKFFNTEVKFDTEVLEVKKERVAIVQSSSNIHMSLSLDLNVSLTFIDSGNETINKAEVFLLPEELPCFTRALIQHPIVFPINYSQHLSIKCGVYRVFLTSQEPPGNFAERLSEALRVLE